MTTRTITISEALDMAVAKLPPLRRTVMRMRLRSEGFRSRTLAELRLKLSEDAECCAMLGDSFGAGLADESFGDETPFSIDLGNLEQFLQLILKYLPQILEIIFKLFAAITFIALSLSMSGSANAQMVCANGQCQLLRTTAAVATAPVRAVVNVVTAPSRYASVSSASGYGSAGTPVVQSYGSAGGSTYSSERWRLGDRIRENIAARQSSRAASYGYGSTGGSVQSYGCAGTPVMLLTVPASSNPNCTCNPCNCAPSSPVAPPVPLTQHAPPIALPPEQAVRELFVQVFPR